MAVLKKEKLMSNDKLVLTVDQFDQKGHVYISGKWPVEGYFSKFMGRYDYSFFNAFNCANCDGYPALRPLNPGAKPENLRFEAKTSCEETNTVPYQVTLKVPSGKIVFADSLWRNGLPHVKSEEYISMNSSKGRKLMAEFYEAQGIAFGSVLNTSPRVLLEQTSGSILVVANAWDEQDEPISPENTVEIGDITTDLWAYSFMDHDDYLAKGGELDEFIQVASVAPGTYTFTHYAHADDFDFDESGPQIYAEGVYSPELISD